MTFWPDHSSSGNQKRFKREARRKSDERRDDLYDDGRGTGV
jgi:hypothetical protein